jgi:methylthioxylose transferase
VAFAVTVAIVSLAVALAANAARNGSSGWDRVFDLGPHGSFEAKNEVLAGLHSLSYGVHFFLDRFAELVPSQPVGLAGHPPGLPVLLHVTGITTAAGLAAVCIAAVAGVAPATYALGRALDLGDRTARRAALLASASPSLVLLGVSSTDAVFAFFATVSAALLVSRRRSLRAGGCIALAFAALLSWIVLAIGAWATLVVWQRRGWRPALGLAAACGCAVVALDGLLAARYGYDPIGAVRATGQVYRSGIAGDRPYAFWVVGSPVAFAIMAGLPLSAAWVVATVRRATPAVAVAALIAVSALIGFTKAEVERIWLPFVPLVCVAAATVIDDERLRRALIVLGIQTLATTLLFATVW